MFPFLLFLGFGGALAFAVRALTSPPPTLHMLGDSQACIVSTLTTDKDPRRTFIDGTTCPGRPVHVTCKIGSRVADWNPQIAKVPIARGDTVLMFLGSNELANKPDPAAIAKSVLSRGARLIWIGPPRIRGSAGTAPAFLRAKLAPLGVPYFDSQALNLAQADGVHPTPTEAARWRDAIFAAYDLA